ncbi:formamidopyrimidine-DNA glycosylase [Hylemonella gracilis str. Niagara R]|uniref:Formamidopyrimidine-DNA glycosylase n=1 Tax=Hylemonella gracilis str. Niagara R TaxID=1458275 RepID=A0A016XKY1_9BURK|nr:bifunctional DNA-formamidopyrimidine glycosylase/DNA-(apurinic or apyrimidinic site) lyase [Hylemonella gracilis]EYC52525.1 formamidopyrimidine-DNA glycosylase [Hylemonella gracilis str. Niagara R]
MPELPEVEATRLSFADRITGGRVLSASVGLPLRWPLGIAPAQLVGRCVRGVRRRGKYLLLDLDEGLLLLHLGMSGSLSFTGEDAQAPRPRGPHDHFDLQTDRGLLRLNDPRRFGAVVWAASDSASIARKLLDGLGVEPLDASFEARAFHAALQKRRSAIKQVLLAGDVVVGVGNIYASEALFLAGIRPTLSAARISGPRAVKLHAAIRDVLGRALAAGGTTLRNYSNAVGERGNFQFEAKVYGRAGQPCTVCGSPIRLMRQGQRATYFCVQCQKA